MNRLLLTGIILSFISGCSSEDNLHVPSPDWRDQVIYFVLTDRFANGDPSNDDQGQGEFNPSQDQWWNGGDLKGLTNHLDYIRHLGATAVWITPPVLNQAVSPDSSMGGYHGYWQSDIMEIDPHLGALEDYRNLSRSLHERGMYLVQDVVTNHMGDYFTYNGNYDPLKPQLNFALKTEDVPQQPPFNQNDVRNPAHAEAAVYNFSPAIEDYNNKEQKLKWSLMELDDINTANPEIRKVLRKSFGYWIREAGVDGFRFDTPIYVEHDFWHDFLHSEDSEYPGMLPIARSLGKEHFLNFGETWIGSGPNDDKGEKESASFLGTPEKPEMNAILQFPLQITMEQVFRQGLPTAYLEYRMGVLKKHYTDPAQLVTFVDNHDMPRFLAGANVPSLHQALLFLFTTPGIPVIYYGTEQHFTKARAAMFAGGSNSGGVDHFDEESTGFKYIRSLADLRKSSKTFTRGDWQACASNQQGPGVLAYKMLFEGETHFVLMNSSSEPVLASGIKTGLPEGIILQQVFGADHSAEPVTVTGGLVNMRMPAFYAAVFKPGNKTTADKLSAPPVISSVTQQEDKLLISGTADSDSVGISIDGSMSKIYRVAVADRQWQAEIACSIYEEGEHAVVPFTQTGNQFQPGAPYLVNFEFEPKKWLFKTDPSGDDNGPDGSYTYPAERSFQRQLDITGVTVISKGSNIELEIEMAEPLTTTWNPTNGFDHVHFSVYFDFPGSAGSTVLPQRNSKAPEGINWDYAAMFSGWHQSMYNARGANEKEWGTPVNPVPKCRATGTNTVRLSIAAPSLGHPESLEGLKIYIATWDWGGEGGFRDLRKERGEYTFGGPETGPKIMDDIPVFTL